MTTPEGPDPAPGAEQRSRGPGDRGPARIGWREYVEPIHLDRPVTDSLARRGSLSTIGLVAQGGLRFLTSWLVGRLAGKAALGVVASAVATATLLALLWPTTTGSAAAKYLARARGARDTAELLGVAHHLSRRTLQATAVLSAAAIPVWVFLDGGSLVSSLPVAALCAAFSGYSFTRGVLLGTGHVARATLWDLVSVGIGVVLLVLALVAGMSGAALVLPMAAALTAYTLAGWPYRAAGTVPRALRREIDHFVLLGVAGTLASTGFLQLSMLAVRRVSPLEEAGQYAAALALATPASLLAVSLSLVLFPSLAEIWGRGDVRGFRAQTDRAMRALTLVMVGIFGALVLSSRFVVRLVWGPTFDQAARYLPVLALAVLATTLGMVSVNAVTTRSRRGMQLTTAASIGGMVVGVIVWLLAAPALGAFGIALGYLAGTVCIAAVPLVVVWRTDQHHWGPLFGRVALGLVLLGALVAAQHLLGLSLWLDPLVAAVFLLAWTALERRDLHLLPLRGRLRTMAVRMGGGGR
jgi:O-antigen/teichoic acid export membrane protein